MLKSPKENKCLTLKSTAMRDLNSGDTQKIKFFKRPVDISKGDSLERQKHIAEHFRGHYIHKIEKQNIGTHVSITGIPPGDCMAVLSRQTTLTQWEMAPSLRLGTQLSHLSHVGKG